MNPRLNWRPLYRALILRRFVIRRFIVVLILWRAATQIEVQAGKRGEHQFPPRGELQRTRLGVGVGMDHQLLTAVPLHQQYLVPDLPSADAVDCEITEQSAGPQI